MKTYNLAKEIGIINLPIDANRFKFFNDANRPYLSYFLGVETKRFYIPKGYIFISTAKEMTEEKAKMIMPTLSKEGYEYIYQDFINTENWFNTSLEAFHSFMYSIGMPCHNPYGKEKPTYETVNILEYFKYRKELYAWQEAEAKLVNTVILYKEK